MKIAIAIDTHTVAVRTPNDAGSVAPSTIIIRKSAMEHRLHRRLGIRRGNFHARQLGDEVARRFGRDRLDFRHRRCPRSEEQTSELQSLMRISYAVFCLKKTKKITH